MLEVRNLSKKYGSKQVLNSINLRFEKGKIYGIVGENGAGKTTFFKCLAELENYDGEIISPYKQLKNHLGFLETNPLMMSYITGWEYLKLLCKARNIKTDNFEEQNIFKLPLNQYTETYSTGMKKKLAFMGVLLRKNDILILDEPFNGVDIQSNIIITDIIQELKALGKTILISSHIFATLRESCDGIILLSKGNVVKTATKAEYDVLEAEMKKKVIGDNLKKLNLE